MPITSNVMLEMNPTIAHHVKTEAGPFGKTLPWLFSPLPVVAACILVFQNVSATPQIVPWPWLAFWAACVALLAAAQAGLPIGEYAPNRVKKTVVGVGHADKRQVMHMVRLQLPGSNPAGPDAADALAIAICHAHYGGVEGDRKSVV